MSGFSKRFYSYPAFRAAVREVAAHRGELRAARRSGVVSRAMAERLMLTVTQFNDCRY